MPIKSEAIHDLNGAIYQSIEWKLVNIVQKVVLDEIF